MGADWPHQIEIETSREAFDDRLGAIEGWLQSWEIPHRIGSTLGAKGTLRVCFADEAFARAFHYLQGGRRIPDDELARTLQADGEDEELYQKLSDEFDQ